MGFALDSAHYNQSNSAYKREARLVVVLTFASGVPTIDTARSASGFTIAGDTGVYTGTMPKSSRGILLGQCQMATPDDATVCVKSFDPSAGTFAFDVHNSAGAVDVATGDEVYLYFILEGG